MTMKCRPPQMLTDKQAVAALLIVDEIGDLANRAPRDINAQLSQLRTRLKRLVNEIDNPGGDAGALLG